MGSTPVILAAKKGHKDVVLILTQKGANLDLFNRVSIFCVYNKPHINIDKIEVLLSKRKLLIMIVL